MIIEVKIGVAEECKLADWKDPHDSRQWTTHLTVQLQGPNQSQAPHTEHLPMGLGLAKEALERANMSTEYSLHDLGLNVFKAGVASCPLELPERWW